MPLAAVGIWLAQPEERKQQILEKVPSGVGGRALAAGAAFGILLLLARVALPAFHGASTALRGVLFRLREKPKALRASSSFPSSSSSTSSGSACRCSSPSTPS